MVKRATFYHLHSLLGVPLALFLCFVLLTGTLAVVSNELDWLTNPAVRSNPSFQQTDWQTIYQQAQEQAGKDTVYSISAPIHNGFAAKVQVRRADKSRYYLYFDPSSGNYQGKGRWFNWQNTLRRLHRHLMMPITLGITIVTSTSFIFLGLGITGLLLQRNWLKTLWRLPRTTNSRVFWGDLHRIIGLWSCWLLLVICITGIWYLLERWGLNAAYPSDGQVQSVLAQQKVVSVAPQTFAKMLLRSEIERPELDIKRVRFPAKPNQPVLIEGQADGALLRDRANNLAFDPVTAELLSTRDGGRLSLHARISEAADPLHFGRWGGYFSKSLYFLFGLLLTSLVISGTCIYSMRILKKKRSATLSGWQLIIRTWKSIGAVKWLGLVIILSSFIFWFQA